jgi:hypothetical protein
MNHLAQLERLVARFAQGTSNNNNNNNNANNNDQLPDLATITEAASTSSAASTQRTASTASGRSTQTDTEDSEETASSGSTASTRATATFPDAVSSTVVFRLTGLPTIAGAGIPELVIPYTEAAPFMQRSSMPEGTVFIAVGAVLALFGACVLLWRVLVAWSINRSVKRSAMASIRGEKSSGKSWSPSHAAGKAAYYKEYETGSSMSLDALNSQGKPLKHFRDDHEAVKRQSSAPVAGLFFSPTAQTSNRASSAMHDNRASNYLPAGYYASPSADLGARNSSYGGSLAPYSRHSVAVTPSPPESPDIPVARNTSSYYGGGRDSSRDGLRPHGSRDGYAGASSSSLAVGIGGNARSNESLGGQRAPSQVFDDMLDVHGHGPRERF